MPRSECPWGEVEWGVLTTELNHLSCPTRLGDAKDWKALMGMMVGNERMQCRRQCMVHLHVLVGGKGREDPVQGSEPQATTVQNG